MIKKIFEIIRLKLVFSLALILLLLDFQEILEVII